MHCAAPPESAATVCSESRPALIASTMPSATPMYVPARITWFTAFTAWPDPIGPTWVIVVPTLSRTGRARSRSAASPPMKIDRVPFFAPSMPPETGRRASPTPFAAQPLGERPGRGRRDRRHVDDERAGLRALGHAGRAEQDRLDVRRVRHDRDDDLARGSHGGRALSAAPRRAPRARPRARAFGSRRSPRSRRALRSRPSRRPSFRAPRIPMPHRFSCRVERDPW